MCISESLVLVLFLGTVSVAALFIGSMLRWNKSKDKKPEEKKA